MKLLLIFLVSLFTIGSDGPVCNDPEFNQFNWQNPQFNRNIESNWTYNKFESTGQGGSIKILDKSINSYESKQSIESFSHNESRIVNRIQSISMLAGDNHAHANVCACGASGEGNNNPRKAPCDCGCWVWNGKQWVHLADGHCRHRHHKENVSVGNVPVIPILILLMGLAVFSESEPPENE